MSSKLRLILLSTLGLGARTALSAWELSPNSRGQGCPRSVRVLVSALAVLVCAHAFAHPYASGLTNLGGAIRFILNEPATDVSVIFGNHAATNALGPLAKGLNSFSLNYNAVTYTNYSIVVYKVGSGSVSQISSNGVLNDFFGPRGIGVNRNPKTGNFGRTYIANANTGTDAARATQKGVYVLNADQSDALGYGGTSYPTNQVLWGNNTTYGPYRVFVGPDDMVYVSDASGGAGGGVVGGGVWRMPPDLRGTINDVFTYNGAANGSPYCVIASHVTGSLASNNLVLYTMEWNRFPYQTVWQYSQTIQGSTFPWTIPPEQLAATSGNSTVNAVVCDMTIAPDGKFFCSENRNSGGGTGNQALFVYASDGNTYLWDAQTAAGGDSPLINAYSVAVSPDGRYVALGNAVGNFYLMNLTNGIPDISTLTTIAGGFGGTVRGVSWDAADNLYGTSGTDDLLRVFSLGLTTTATTSNDNAVTNGTFQFSIQMGQPLITSQPQGQAIVAGSTASFFVNATGAPPLHFQWQCFGTNVTDGPRITGSQTTNLVISPTQTNDSGDYRVVVANASGSATSSIATLTVLTLGSFPIGWSQFTNTPGGTSSRHDDIYFTDPINGWASHNNNIYRTTNGGLTWTTNLTVAGTHFRSVCFATPQVGFAGNLGSNSYDGGVFNSSNILYRSYNGGVNWSNVPGFSEAGMKGLCAMYVLDSQHVYGAGRVRGPAHFIKSTDGGTNWSMVSLTAMGVMNGIMDVYFQNTNNGWVVGMDTNAYTTGTMPPAIPYYGRIARTTDGGNTWTPVVTTPVPYSYFWKISWPSTNVGYVALQQNATRTNIIFYKTTDGGANWTMFAIPETTVGLSTNGFHFYLQGLGFVSETEGWIGGASGLPSFGNGFLHTVDGGATWTPAGFNNTFFINRIRFLSPNLGFASGANTYIYNMPLAITSQPRGQVVVGPTNIFLSVTASGNSPINYQWRKDGLSAIGATNPVLVLNNVTRTNSGTYSVLVSNPNLSLQSSNALVTVMVPERLSPPAILPGGKLQFVFTDSDGGALLTTNDLARFKVQASTNLTDWTVLTNSLTLTNGMALLQDTWTNAPMRYYRVLESY